MRSSEPEARAKTALADLIAAGCDSIPSEAWAAEEWANPSFLVRARPLIGEGKVKVTWGTGDPAIRSLRERGGDDAVSYPRVRYLSQQFVEDLCSAGGMTDELLQEIERVIFEGAPSRGAGKYAELRGVARPAGDPSPPRPTTRGGGRLRHFRAH